MKLAVNALTLPKNLAGIGFYTEKLLENLLALDADELESSAVRSAITEDGRQAGKFDILRADVDISDFRPPTILLLNEVGKRMRESPSFIKSFLALNAWGEKNVTREMTEIIMDDILHRRNMEVIRNLEKAVGRYDTIVIPWGALHMKEIEAEVLKMGFKLQEERQRVSIDFGKMFLAVILGRI